MNAETRRRRVSELGAWWQTHGPQWLGALLAAATGMLLVAPRARDLLQAWHILLRDGAGGLVRLADLAVLPPVLLGGGLLLMAPGLAQRARLAWVISVLLAGLGAGLEAWAGHRGSAAFALLLALLLALLVYLRRYDRSSVAAGSAFGLLGIGGLTIYGVLGSLWMGDGYAPPIHDLGTAFYYTIETMSTVGYGDIVPHSMQARLFTVSLIVAGITVFATTLSVVIGPLIGGSIKRALEQRMHKEQRRNHFVILGVSSLAYTMWRDLHERGVPVTVVVAPDRQSPFPAEADVVVGDATRNEVLEEAGVPHAQAVLTLRDDDAENAFAVLAVKELAPGVKTIAGVNDARHLAKIRRVQPDMLFAPQVLGSDLLVRTLFDEPIDNDTVSRLLFPQR